jgi:hypothetical protein
MSAVFFWEARLLRGLFAALLLFSTFHDSAAQTEAFPALNGETLSGKKVSLPGESRVPILIVIGFSRASQQQTLEWGKCMRQLKAQQVDFNYRPVAELESVPRPIRGFVSKNIRSAVPSELHDNFVLLFEGEKTLKQLTHFDRSEEAYVILLDAKAGISWQDHGPCNDARVSALHEKMTSIAH